MDDSLIIYYHLEYLISLVTGIFDNLAIETANLYNIQLEGLKISLSNTSGKQFLKEVKTHNPNLKCHIDNFREFINLIYMFRNKVVHREGLTRSITPISPHWSNFIPNIDQQARNYIKNCGDKKSVYSIISEWGLVHDRRSDTYLLDPYFFAKNVLRRLFSFCDEYLKLINFPKAMGQIDETDEFFNESKRFRQCTIRR